MKLFLFFLALLIAAASYGQQSLIAMSVETSFTDTTADGGPDIRPNTLFTAVMKVSVDGDNIYKLHVKLGSTQGGSEYLSTSFDYNVPGTFGSTSYQQIGSNILLGLGSFTGMVHYYAEVQVERPDHNFETALTFSR